ncbi:MAG: helix-turn-helix transcriptional regulator [Planctomycetaceae bacterium]|nr:helix-turn-helix transcriptional regulator [Planctomycetaceae bacterium]
MTELTTNASSSTDWQLLSYQDLTHLCRSDCPFWTPSACDLRVALRERLKELSFLLGVLQFEERYSDSLPDLLQGIVHLVPPSWQYPEVCQVRLTLDDECYQTNDFRESRWVQRALIYVRGQRAGLIEIVYLDERPESSEGPFLREERDLLDAIARHIGKMVERSQLEQQLKTERAALREANIALKQVLTQIEGERRKIYDAIRTNVERILTPTLRALASVIPVEHKGYIAQLQSQLEDLVSPFVSQMSRQFTNLTPAEIEICNMVRGGMTTKEIARLRRVAPATVSKQRERIRRKLELCGSDTNLTTHLVMLITESGHSQSKGLSDEDLVF